MYSLVVADDYSFGDSILVVCNGGECSYDGLTFNISDAYFNGYVFVFLGWWLGDSR